MAIFASRTRRVFFAGGFALALAVAPAAVAVSYPVAHGPATLADTTSDGCTSGESIDAYSLACVPDVVPNSIGGAPSEMQLTNENPGIGSPTGHGR